MNFVISFAYFEAEQFHTHLYRLALPSLDWFKKTVFQANTLEITVFVPWKEAERTYVAVFRTFILLYSLFLHNSNQRS